METLGPWRFEVDVEATRTAYEAAKPYVCDCCYCRNFALARDVVFPAEFKDLLARLGVDPVKPGEIWEAGGLYSGWYHVVGQLQSRPSTGDRWAINHDFSIWISPFDGEPRSIVGEPLLSLHFFAAKAPWLLEEPQP